MKCAFLNLATRRSVVANVSYSVVSDCHTRAYSPPGSSVHGISQARNTGVGCHFLLQGSFPTQGSKLVSCTAGRFFTIWATREGGRREKKIISPGCWTPSRYSYSFSIWTLGKSLCQTLFLVILLSSQNL